MKVPLEEQEVTFTFFPPAVNKYAQVYASNPVHIRRLKKLCSECPEDFILEREDDIGAFFRVHQKCFSYHKRRTRSLTEEQKAASAARLLSARNTEA